MSENNGIGMPPMGDGMDKKPPQKGDDTPEGSKNMYKNETDKEKKDRWKKGDFSEDEKIIRRAQGRWKKADEFESDNRKAALEDLKFKAGDQWPADIAAKRQSQKRPCLTINTCPTITHQIINDIRENRPAINISPLGDQATKDSAEMIAAYIRAVERDSAADIAYDTAIQYAVDIGFGYWRVATEYEDEKSFDQVPVIRRIRNPFTVLLDPGRQEPDGSDSRYGFISEMMDRKEFEDEYPDAQPIPWKLKGIGDAYKEWVTKDQIRIVEYFELNYEMRRLVELENGTITWWDDLSDEKQQELTDNPDLLVNDRESGCPVVKWYKMTAVEILDREDWVGKWIPIIEVIGDELDVEGKVIKAGVIRNAKDPMRMKNYWATIKAELIALQPKAPYIGVEGSFEGFEDEWERSATDTLAYLEYALVTADNGQPLPPPSRQPPPAVPAGMVQAEEGAEQDILRTTGVRFDASKQERTFDESGKALMELRRNTDIGSYHYTDNFSRSLKHQGRILLDLMSKLIVKKKKVPAIGEDNKEYRMMIDPDHTQPTGTISQGQNQPPMKVVNPTLGKYGVTVTIGPSYATKRIEAEQNLMKFIGQIPDQLRPIVGALIAKYADWPASQELYKVLVKLSPAGIFEPDPANMSPESVAIIKNMQNQLKQLMAERAQMIRDLADQQGDRMIKLKKIDKDFEGKLMKIIADLTKFDKKHSLDLAQAIASHMSEEQGEGSLPAGNTGQGSQALPQSMER